MVGPGKFSGPIDLKKKVLKDSDELE